MPTRFEMAEALVMDAKKRLDELKKIYSEALHAKSISVDLQIRIKGVLDNLRSALDYCGRELYSKCVGGPTTTNVYFPIAKRGAVQADFRSLVGKNIPGLLAARPDLVSVLESFQGFASPVNGWLPDFATLCNENKHEQLTPQTRTETIELRIESQGAVMSREPV